MIIQFWWQTHASKMLQWFTCALAHACHNGPRYTCRWLRSLPHAHACTHTHTHTHTHAENVDQIHQAVLSGHRSNNPYRVLKAVVDMMRQRYCGKNYQHLSLEEILTEVKWTDLRTDLRQWLSEVWEGGEGGEGGEKERNSILIVRSLCMSVFVTGILSWRLWSKLVPWTNYFRKMVFPWRIGQGLITDRVLFLNPCLISYHTFLIPRHLATLRTSISLWFCSPVAAMAWSSPHCNFASFSLFAYRDPARLSKWLCRLFMLGRRLRREQKRNGTRGEGGGGI